MKSSLQYRRNIDMVSAAASVSETARTDAVRLEVLGATNKLEVQHQLEFACCGLWLRSDQYMILDDRKDLLLTAAQELPERRWGRPNYRTVSALHVYQFSGEPIFQMHFDTPGILEFGSSNVSVTLPSEVLIGSLTREDKNTTVVLGSTTTSIKAFDFDGHFLFLAKPGGKTVAEESIHNAVMNNSRIAKIRSLPGYSIMEYKKDEIASDVRALLLAATIWLEIIERKKPRWRREGLHFTRA